MRFQLLRSPSPWLGVFAILAMEFAPDTLSLWIFAILGWVCFLALRPVGLSRRELPFFQMMAFALAIFGMATLFFDAGAPSADVPNHFALDLSRMIFGALVLAALGRRPDRHDIDMADVRQTARRSAGLALMLAALLTYIAMPPSLYVSGAFEAGGLWVRSLPLLCVLPVSAIAWWFAEEDHWRMGYAFLAVFAALMTLGDGLALVDFLDMETGYASQIANVLGLLMLGAALATMGQELPQQPQPRRTLRRRPPLPPVWSLGLIAGLGHVLWQLGRDDPFVDDRHLIVAFLLMGLALLEWLGSQRYARLVDEQRERLVQREHEVRGRELKRALQLSETRYRVLVQTMNEGLWTADLDGVLTQVNDALARMLGLEVKTMVGLAVWEFFDDADQKAFKREWSRLLEGKPRPFEITWQGRDGVAVETLNSPRLLCDSEGETLGVCSVVEDMRHQKRIRDEMQQLVQYDPMTGLPSQALFRQRLSRAMYRAHHEGSRGAVFLMDLDRFKRINESLGHNLGDRLLKEIAQRLKAHVSELETVARLGGDEFTLIITDLGGTLNLMNRVEAIMGIFDDPFFIERRSVSLTASLGVAIFPDDAPDADALIQCADAAMQHAKRKGRNGFHFYDEEVERKSLERLELETDIRKALEQEDFWLWYQPKQDISSGLVVGVEALARWRHPQHGILSPDRFIPVAEDSGLIHPLGAWVIEEACRQAQAWVTRGLPPIVFAVNVSPVQFNAENLPAQVLASLAKTGLDPSLLELEITESLAMEDPERTLRLLAHLKALGLRISIDDFGAGQTSLIYLKQFPVDSVKIDRAFIQNLSNNREDRAIVDAVIRMAQGLGMSVVAEGVETREDYKILRDMGCDQVQGYLISKPVGIDSLVERAASGTPAPT